LLDLFVIDLCGEAMHISTRISDGLILVYSTSTYSADRSYLPQLYRLKIQANRNEGNFPPIAKIPAQGHNLVRR
jgi:hypothetical protein